MVPEYPPEDANDIFEKMKKMRLIPKVVAMLDGLCKDALVQEVMKLFGLMHEKGTIPEVVIYMVVVEGFCKVAKFDDVKRIFRKDIEKWDLSHLDLMTQVGHTIDGRTFLGFNPLEHARPAFR